MRIQSTKILSKLVLFLVILVGCAGVSQAQWTGLTNPFPAGFAEHCLLLTDGTIMCHQYRTNRWHRLKPDINGSYQNGSWDVPGFTVANMPNGTDTTTVNGGCAPCEYAPLFFASAVLPDSRVVVIGGEYNTNGNTWTNIGFLYDPITNTWSSQLTVPGTFTIGDAQSIVLPNGTMLLANISGTDIASFNPATLTFTALAPTSKDDSNDQENWNILPNGRVLTVDSRIQQHSQVYNPATNAWEAAVDTRVNLADFGLGTMNSSEVGPGVLRPDKTIIYFSGTNSGLNSVYDTNTGTWTATAAAGNFPVSGAGHFAVADGPASLLPNGNVLVMASPVLPTGVFNRPSHFYEFDGTNLTQVADAPNAASFISYQGRFLLLPTGEVLLIAYDQNATADLQLYSNGGSPQNAWRPVITSAPANVNAGNTYAISGKLFNGFSEGASYGDDAQMSTNYPLVRIINHATGHVFYARTHDHSRMGVEPVDSNEIVTTQFDAPAGMESGASDLVVVANGIASQPIVINGSRTLTVASTNPSSGVSISVSPDNNGTGTGTTQFSLTYNNNTSVSLAAPATTGGNNFQKWQRNGVDWATSQLTNVVMDANYTMTAVYGLGTGPNVAAYDPILKAPKCGQPGNACDSGTLLNGRGNISGGPEPNQPNTINNSCSDGSQGTYHVDESVDRIRVATADGSTLAPDKMANFEVTYWATSTASDFLDLFYLADVGGSNWIYMTTLRPQTTGLQVVTVNRQLAGTGNLQAVRAILRSGGSTALCVPGNVNDHDDLVFAAPAPPPTLMIESANPVDGVNITVSPNDINGQGNGTTEFTRIYNYNTNVTLTAPATAGGNVFSRWRLNGFDLTTSLTASVAVVPFTTITAVYVTPQRTLSVASTNPASGVNITVSPPSNNGVGSGLTPFSLPYNQNTTVTLAAPASAGGNIFQKWQRGGVDWSTSQATTVTLDANYTMTAVYVTPPQQTLTVASTNPASGVNITVSPNDNNGLGNGTTQFSRTYNQNTTVSLTAPATAGGNTFQKWQRNGADWSTSQATTVTLDANYTMTAVYVSSSTSSLMGCWQFDENSGTTAADCSGNGNTGALTSGATWAAGHSGSAVIFDGVDDYVQVGAQPSLVMTSTASFTAWIYPTGAGSNGTYGGTILVKEGEYVIARFPNGTIQWGFANSSPGWQFIDTGYVAPLNQWTHIAVTYDNGTIKTYANGSLVHTYGGSGSIGDAITGQNDFRIGGRQVISQYFQGRIDEVRVYNRALTASEVGSIFSGLTGYWKFDENSGTTAADSSDNGNTGTLNSGASWTSGQIGAAVNLDGVTGYVKIKDGKVSTSTTGTISAWVKANSLVNARKIVSYGGAAAAGIQGLFALEIRQDGSNYYFSVISVPFDGSPVVNSVHGSTVLQSGVWYHVAVTSDGSSWKLYVNGVAETLTTQLGNGNTGKWFGNTSAAAPDKTYIGAAWFNGFDQGFFNGAIDDARIYDRALSASEIATLSSGLVGYWKFDENSGTTAADSSGNNNTGILNSGAGWTTGQNGSAVSFDGVDDYVQVSAPSSLVMTSTASFTTWIYPTGAGSNGIVGGTILAKEGEYVINRFPDGKIQWGFANSNPGWQFIDTGYVAPLNQWTYIAVTYDNGTIKTYANGTLVHTYSGSGSIGDQYPALNDFRIGGRQLNAQHFQGRIDEVRLYNRAITASEISAPPASLVATVTSDNSYDLYFNGIYKGSGSDWAVAQTYNMSMQASKNVLAIRGVDAGWVAGLLADLSVDGQRTGSNTTWKVSKTAPANWTDPNFDDSTWANATDYGAYGVGPWGTNVTNMPLDTPGRWIWSSNNDLDDLVYLRVTFGTPQNATAIVTTDNSYDLYFNGTYKGSGSDWTHAQTYTVPTQTGKNVVAIRCADAGGVAGLLAELQVNGQRLGSNLTWKVSLSAPANWTDVNFDDSGWANATDYGGYGVSPWFTNVAGMPTDTPARWIWSSNNDLNDLVFVRVSFNVP